MQQNVSVVADSSIELNFLFFTNVVLSTKVSHAGTMMSTAKPEGTSDDCSDDRTISCFLRINRLSLAVDRPINLLELIPAVDPILKTLLFNFGMAIGGAVSVI
jgi:hypothetical protein